MIYLKDEKSSIAFGKTLGELLEKNDVITLNGDLGAGKTTITKSAAKALMIEEPVTSPTFTIVCEYSGRLPLYHFDAYRITDEEEMYFIGFDEYLTAGGVCIIEWAENIKGILPKKRLDINIEYHDDNTRKLSLTPHGERYENLAKELMKHEDTWN